MGYSFPRGICLNIFTARIPKYRERYCFHTCLSVHSREGTFLGGKRGTYLGSGVPSLVRWVTAVDDGGGAGTYLGWGVPTLKVGTYPEQGITYLGPG